MSEFWESFTAGADATIETLGEWVTVGGEELKAVVHDTVTNPVAVPGGISPGVTHLLHVSLTDGNRIADGSAVTGRQLTGAVITKSHFGGGWMIQAGPENRAGDGDWD